LATCLEHEGTHALQNLFVARWPLDLTDDSSNETKS
jgi:hypothetical protein